MQNSRAPPLPNSLGADRVSRYDRPMMTLRPTPRSLHPFWRLLVEVAFIMFLFYSNLLMGEFTRSNSDRKTMAFAIHDIFTLRNFSIGLICAGIGYGVFEFWRRKLA